MAARLLGVPPEDCVAFDDAPVGIQAARATGMAVVGLATDHTPTELVAAGADVTIRDFLAIAWSDLSQI